MSLDALVVGLLSLALLIAMLFSVNLETRVFSIGVYLALVFPALVHCVESVGAKAKKSQ